MLSQSPIFTEEDSHLYRFAFLAAKEVLVTCRKWRNRIEETEVGQLDLSQAERELDTANRSLEIWLLPYVKDGKPLDPRDNPAILQRYLELKIREDVGQDIEAGKITGVQRVPIGRELAEARAGTYFAFGFSGQSAHEVVYKLGEATCYAVSLLSRHKDQWNRLGAADSPLRTETMGLGPITGKQAQRLEAELLTEAEQAWNRAPPKRGGGKGRSTAGKKRSTAKGEARLKIIGELSRHHKYSEGSCLNQEPIGTNELARKAKVAASTASSFFKKEFQGHAKYRASCRDLTLLVSALKLLRGDFSPHRLFGRKPPGEGERGHEE